MVKRSITVRLQDQEFKIEFPKIGAIIDIEVNKTAFSQGKYSGLVSSMSVSSILSLDLIDATSTFLVLIPTLNKNLKVENLFDLDPEEALEMVVQYKKVFFPWYSKIIEELKLKEEELNKLYATLDEKNKKG